LEQTAKAGKGVRAAKQYNEANLASPKTLCQHVKKNFRFQFKKKLTNQIF